MLRVVFTIILPLLLPTVLYLVWTRLAAWSQRGEIGGSTTLPWLWLMAAGVVLLAAVLFVIPVHFGTRATGVYVPPRLVNGRIVPGHIAPEGSK